MQPNHDWVFRKFMQWHIVDDVYTVLPLSKLDNWNLIIITITIEILVNHLGEYRNEKKKRDIVCYEIGHLQRYVMSDQFFL